MDLVGRGYPWSQDKVCVKRDCLPYKRRMEIVRERKEIVMAKVSGEPSTSHPTEGASVCLPGCMEGGVNYTMECVLCRRNNIRRQCHGNTSMSAYKMGREHENKIEAGVPVHPITQHF